MEDTTYLTPIPEETLMAFQFGTSISGKLQAVIAARRALATTRLKYKETPKVVSVEELTLTDANKRIGKTEIDNKKVWLVLFEDDWQIFPPDPQHTITPAPPSHGYVCVVVNPAGDGGSIVSGNCNP